MIAIIADIHGNFPALRAVIDAADRMGCSRYICLGDVTGYYAQPDLCIDLLQRRRIVCILGNHDEYMITGTSCPRSKTVSGLMTYQRSVMKPCHLSYLKSLSRSLREDGCFFVHGGWNDYVDEYLYRVSASQLPDGDELYFSGHTHVQILAQFPDKTYCNPGSVGQPRDGDPRAAFAILDGREIVLQRVEYDIDETAGIMKTAGFEPRIYESLYVGAQIGGRIDKVVID